MTGPSPDRDSDLADETGEPTAHEDRREHAKADPRPDDDALAARTDREREEIGDGSGGATV